MSNYLVTQMFLQIYAERLHKYKMEGILTWGRVPLCLGCFLRKTLDISTEYCLL